MKRILVTGGIGSGKSYVVSILTAMGIPAYDCDSRAKALYVENPMVSASVREIAGDDIIKNGKLQRDILAKVIFSDPIAKRRVENVVFPAVIEDFRRWCEVQKSEIVILESAIALENKILEPMYDEVVVVTAPVEVRISRVMSRDNVSREGVVSRIDSQWSEPRRLEMADYIIINDNKAPLMPQIEEYVNRR